MDSNFNLNKNKLKELKDSFAEFVAVANNIKVLLHNNKLSNGPSGNDRKHDSIINPNVIKEMPEFDCVTNDNVNAHNSTVVLNSNVINAVPEFDNTTSANNSIVVPNVITAVPEFDSTTSANNSIVVPNVVIAVPEFDSTTSANNSIVVPNVITTVPEFDSTTSANNSIVVPNVIDSVTEIICSTTSSNNTIIFLNESNAITRFGDGLHGTDSFCADVLSGSNNFSNGGNSVHGLIILPNGSNAITQFDDVLHGTDSSCSDVHMDVDMDMDFNKDRASENEIENKSIETYPQLVEITDVLNWDNFRKFTIGTKTFYTDGELTYEPAMDVMNCDGDNQVEVMINDVDIAKTMDYQNNKDLKARPKPEADIRDCRKFGFKIERHQGCSKNGMFVPTSDGKTKKLCCMYCFKRYPKLERHLRLIHKNETDVKNFVALPLRSKSRRDAIASIRKKGEFVWNSDFQLNHGEFQTSRRPSKKFQTQPWQRIACAKCMGSYSTNSLRNHWRNCTNKSITGERVAKQLGRELEGRIHTEASDELNEIFSHIRDSECIRMVQFDWLVVCYGNEMCLNYSPHYQEGYIRSKLRAAAKVLQLSKNISSDITDLSSLFHVKNCNTVMEAIRNMGKFDRKSKLYGSPGTALTTITLINTVGDLLIVECMKSDDQEKERNAERFLKVFKREVKSKIKKLVSITIAKNRRRKKRNIPTTADIMKLAQYVDTEREACFLQLVEKFSYPTWLNLLQLTAVTILIFNRKRAGEIQNLMTTDFEAREIIADESDMILKTMSKETIKEIKSRMVIRGKKESDVYVLLKPSWEQCIDILIRYRTDVGIPEGNDFLFALPTQTWKVKTVNVWTAINSYAKKCGAENPSSLKGTNLRKHLATYCGTQDLNHRDITNVANFMGHDPRIHNEIYRQNPLASQVSLLAPILNRAQGNSGNQTGHTKAKNAKPARVLYSSDTDTNSDSDSYSDSDSNFVSESSDDNSEEVNKTVRKRCIIRGRSKTQGRKVTRPRGIKANNGSGKKLFVRQATKRKNSAAPKTNKKSKASE